MGAHVSVPMYQRTLGERYLMEALACLECNTVMFPRKGACPRCGNMTRFEVTRLKGTGKVYAATLISGGGAPPEFTEQAEAKGKYAVAIIELDEGPRIIAQMADTDEAPQIGSTVRAVLRRLYVEEGVIRYGYKFRLEKGSEG